MPIRRALKMEGRLTIEAFLNSIDEDLLQYAESFRKHGFTSTSAMKYITEEDLTSLIKMPEGHKRLIMNVVHSKLKTPDKSRDKSDTKKRKELPSPGLSPEIKQPSKRADNTVHSKINKKTIRSIRGDSETQHSSSSMSIRSRRSLDLMSPSEKYVKVKEIEVQVTEREICEKRHELDEIMDKIKNAAKDIGTKGKKCSNCHLRNHTVRSCTTEKCESAFECGDLAKHYDERAKILERKREITKLQTKLKKLEMEYAGREAAFTRVHQSVNKDIEDVLIEEVVKSLLTERNENNFYREIGLIQSLPKTISKPKNTNVYTPMQKKLESFGINFPKKSSTCSEDLDKDNRACHDGVEKLFPQTLEEEIEQLSMATKRSSMALKMPGSPKIHSVKTIDLDETQDPSREEENAADSHSCNTDDDKEAASILLSLLE